jgi:hypothetical protein
MNGTLSGASISGVHFRGVGVTFGCVISAYCMGLTAVDCMCRVCYVIYADQEMLRKGW